MRAVTVARPGEPATLTDLPVPEPAAGQVRVKVKAAGLNAIDNVIASGGMGEALEHRYPLVLGRDAAGVVDAVGTGVTGISVGDEVLGHELLAPPVQQGTLAEYAVFPAESVTPKPADLDFDQAAALPLAGAAALAAVGAVDLHVGETVLVVGASGGVGSYAVQLAVALGATVIATGLPEEADRLVRLGATEVVDYRKGVADQVRALRPEGVDALVDLVSPTPDRLLENAEVVREGGRASSPLGAAHLDSLEARGITGANVNAAPLRDVVEPLAEQAAAGTLEVDVEQVLPLERAIDGLAVLAEGRAQGKTVVHIAD